MSDQPNQSLTSGARVVAVVVTFRRAPVLDQCLQGLAAQTRPPDAVVVVDNGSTSEAVDEETAAVLEAFDRHMGAPPLHVVRPYANLGPGGGYARGLQRAFEAGADWLWVMDDDVEPEPECLGRLLAASISGEYTNPQRMVYWPSVINPDGSLLKELAWSGFLLPADAIQECGLPREDFVWWSEDTEYTYLRLRDRAGYEHVHVGGAIAHHRHRPRHLPTSTWKLYYIGRNATYVRLYLKKYNYWRLFRLLGSLMRRSLDPPPGEGRVRRLWLATRGVADGVAGRLGRRIEPGTGKPLPRSAW